MLRPLRGGDDSVRIVQESPLPQVPDAGANPDGSSASAQNSSTSATGTSCSPCLTSSILSPKAIPALIYRLLFNAASKTLLEFGRNPRWLGGELGITMVLHTWGQNLGQHIHVHCVVTDGALSPDRERWLTPPRRGFLFPTAALSKVFRGKYLDSLTAAHRSGELRMPGDDGLDDTRAFESLKTSLQSNDWVVYTKAPFAGAANVLAYLGRYTHKSAIANHRLVGFDAEQVRFRWRDYAHGNKRKVMRLDAGEFIRRFLLHVLPPPLHPAAPLRIARQSRARSQARFVSNPARTAHPRAS